MKPISLEMEAFGPYLHRTVCDFTKLYDARLFLINGPTGGGKTTLLDAMCMALYEKATGGASFHESRSFLDMRCLSASVRQETKVSFTFSLDGAVYRFCRGIVMHSKRDGSLDPQISAGCYRKRGEEWQPLATKRNEVTQAAEELLRFNREQFSQVVVLPQGEFRRLLLAPAREKQEILKVLFGTAVWDRVREVLYERSKSLTGQLKAYRDRTEALLQTRHLESVEALSDLLDDTRARCEAADIWAKHTAGALQKATEDQSAGQKLQEAFQRQAQITQQLERLAARKEEMAETKRRLEQAKKVEPLLSLVRRQSQDQADLQQKTAQAARLEQQAIAAAARLEQAGKAHEALPGIEEALERLRAEYSQLQEQRDRLQALKRDRQALAALEREESKLAGEAASAAAQISVLEEALTDANQRVEVCRQAWMDAQVQSLLARGMSQLAEELTEGTPCPVCGSVHHPAPAKPHPQTEGAEAAARADLDAAIRRMTECAEHLEDIRRTKEEIGEKRRVLASKADPLRGQIALRLQSLPTEDAQGLENRFQQVSREGKDLKRQADAIRTEYAGADSACQVAAAQQKAARAALDEARVRAEESAREKLVAMTEAGFDPEDALEPLALSQEEQGRLEQELRQYAAACSQLESEQASLTDQLSGKTPPDLEALETARRQAQTEQEQAAQRCGALHKELEQLQALFGQLQDQQKESAALEKEYRQVERVGSRIYGKSAKVSFHNFVLGIMLDQVVLAASRYLRRLSGERFSLVRSESTAGRGDKGLDIDVLDGRTGGVRRAATLSGGEVFLASLSLAFGLAEVVQATAGGVTLDSIFIDEGFGTLDHSTLDLAMEALAYIQQEGRLVGIISHVSELSARIPARITVCPGEEGARLEIRGE